MGHVGPVDGSSGRALGALDRPRKGGRLWSGLAHGCIPRAWHLIRSLPALSIT